MIRHILSLSKRNQSFGSTKNILDFSEFLERNVLSSAPKQISLATIRNTKEREHYSKCFDRTGKCQGCEKNKNWKKDESRLTIGEAIREAQRCLKCTDAPCQKGCSTSIDIKSFIYNIEKKNWYGAAKVILTDNPLGLSCGQLCPISELCARNCNVASSEKGAIKINKLQEFAVSMFKEMGVKQIRDPKLPKNDHIVFDSSIALIGAGAASLSCATFLGRLGYKNVTIFEKQQHAGGLVVSEIPMNRSPVDDINWEIEQVKQLGIKFVFGKELGKDFTIESLRKEGYECVFLGCGLNEPKKGLGHIYQQSHILNSKSFLPKVNKAVKQDKDVEATPKLSGHVIVLGIGDTALDCARSAYRCGAQRVSVIFRRGWQDIRANDEILIPSKNEGINFIPYEQPLKLIEVDGQYKQIELEQNLPVNNDAFNLKYQLTGDKVTMSFDYLITAFVFKLKEWLCLDKRFTPGQRLRLALCRWRCCWSGQFGGCSQ
ncbi:unnamed protein product [Paramecium octaurelia]|uniref:Uncharacterized protein n=1 Tax=Paramecium octaurelia TaxID=43137 RepID=A0A8S1T626_PAROT|nr:unnamed protein product [Paramecium octaurelia]